MIEDIQKASMLKRAAAYLLDLILLSIVIVGFAALLSYALDYDGQVREMQAHYDRYAKEYGVDFDIKQEEYNALSREEKQAYEQATKAMNKDEAAIICYNKMYTTSFTTVILSILLGYLLLEFAVPLLFKNGQTVGKKIFSLAVVRTDSVRVTPLMMFVRAILGKCTIGTQVPAAVALMIFLGTPNAVALLVVVGIALTQIIMVFFSANHTAIHDRMSGTVVVDMSSQMIFDSTEHLLEFKKARHKEMAEERPYF